MREFSTNGSLQSIVVNLVIAVTENFPQLAILYDGRGCMKGIDARNRGMAEPIDKKRSCGFLFGENLTKLLSRSGKHHFHRDPGHTAKIRRALS